MLALPAGDKFVQFLLAGYTSASPFYCAEVEVSLAVSLEGTL